MDRRKMTLLAALGVLAVAGLVYGTSRKEGPPPISNEMAAENAGREAAARSLKETQDQINMMKAQNIGNESENNASAK